MFGEKFVRDLFSMGDESPLPKHLSYELSVVERALKLCKGCAPEMNLAPYLELIKAADALGCDVVRRGEG